MSRPEFKPLTWDDVGGLAGWSQTKMHLAALGVPVTRMEDEAILAAANKIKRIWYDNTDWLYDDFCPQLAQTEHSDDVDGR